MSKQPPDDESLLEAIFTQLQQAISESDVDEDADLNEELMDGIRNSLSALFGDAHTQSPSVTVVEGGKSVDSSSDSKPPELYFAPEPEEGYPELPQGLSDVQVKVIKGGELFPQKSGSNRGQISVEENEEQVILLGETAYLYRVFCTQGSLKFPTHMSTEISAGQSIDLEAKHIVVKGQNAAKGSYIRLLE